MTISGSTKQSSAPVKQDGWLPDLTGLGGATGSLPKYKAIAAAIARDIKSGVLKPGDRLPPQRELAWGLQVTVGTVTRAYQEAEQLGLVGGEVGRGTYVRPSSEHNRPRSVSLPSDWYAPDPMLEQEIVDPNAPISMQFNFPPGAVGEAALRHTMVELSRDPSLGNLLNYHSPSEGGVQSEAGAAWFAKRGLETKPGEVTVSSGAHNAILATLAALCPTGGKVATEALVYPGLRVIARLLGLDLVPVRLDEEGLCPDALDEVLSNGGINAVYCVPTLQNPTNATMSLERRQDVARVLERHGVPLVEDDLFGLLPSDAPIPVTALIPDLGYCVTSVSKTLSPGLRIGYIRSPARARTQIAAGVRGSTWMASPLTAEIVSRWILEGRADAMLEQRRAIDDSRRQISLRELEGFDVDLPEGSLSAWLHLPDPWHASQFVNAAEREGVLLSAAHAFSIGRARPPFAVRVCLGPPRTDERLVTALGRLKHILKDVDPTQDLAVM